MAERKKSSAMVPLILVGALLFGAGIFQSTRPKAPERREVNTGFVSPPPTPDTPQGSAPENPRTMQAPPAPPATKDAARIAAETDQTTASFDVNGGGRKIKLSLSDAPWLQAITKGKAGNFRTGVLTNLKAEQTKGQINCSPVLTGLAEASFTTIERVTCTAKDGGQIVGDFDNDGDGEFTIEDSDGESVEVRKNGGDFKVEISDNKGR